MATSEAGSDIWHRATGLQRAMILSSLKADAPGAYYQQLVVRLHEKIYPALLLRAAHQSLQRHAALMSRFEFRDGELFQTRISAPASPASEVDLQSSS
ncbi:MAG TPA: hypothetical protein VGQ82_06680, partial [Chthoniobacterales bacterium]|nr:hypothetical protein [Chthoniobacterales bacterium]